ncbi:hypothetical protein, partial [Thiolapillus sp.]|uniref:hypothetical protein n=1 Tax=Thiolapillus sp. TaxID=2017437 RepID=UPI003AF9ADB6
LQRIKCQVNKGGGLPHTSLLIRRHHRLHFGPRVFITAFPHRLMMNAFGSGSTTETRSKPGGTWCFLCFPLF